MTALVSDFERRLLRMAPAVWFLAELKKDQEWSSDRERILAAARQFRSLPVRDAVDCEAIGRALGVALGILNVKDLTPLNESWSPEWLACIRDECDDELDWGCLFGVVARGCDFSEQ